MFCQYQNILFLLAPPATYECYRQTDEDRAFHKALSPKETIKNGFNDGALGMWCRRHGNTFTASKGHNLPGCTQNCYCCRRQQLGSITYTAVLLIGCNIFVTKSIPRLYLHDYDFQLQITIPLNAIKLLIQATLFG